MGATYVLASHALADNFGVLVDKDMRLCPGSINSPPGDLEERFSYRR